MGGGDLLVPLPERRKKKILFLVRSKKKKKTLHRGKDHSSPPHISSGRPLNDCDPSYLRALLQTHTATRSLRCASHLVLVVHAQNPYDVRRPELPQDGSSVVECSACQTWAVGLLCKCQEGVEDSSLYGSHLARSLLCSRRAYFLSTNTILRSCL